MEAQPVPQEKAPGQPVILHAVAGDHLWLGGVGVVHVVTGQPGRQCLQAAPRVGHERGG